MKNFSLSSNHKTQQKTIKNYKKHLKGELMRIVAAIGGSILLQDYNAERFKEYAIEAWETFCLRISPRIKSFSFL